MWLYFSRPMLSDIANALFLEAKIRYICIVFRASFANRKVIRSVSSSCGRLPTSLSVAC